MVNDIGVRLFYLERIAANNQIKGRRQTVLFKHALGKAALFVGDDCLLDAVDAGLLQDVGHVRKKAARGTRRRFVVMNKAGHDSVPRLCLWTIGGFPRDLHQPAGALPYPATHLLQTDLGMTEFS